MHALILGGARSGKSRFAESWTADQAAEQGLPVVYVATAEALDAEMAERIARHREDRDPTWTTLEAPLDLPQALRAVACGATPAVTLVDCLTLWLTNLLLAERDPKDDMDALLSVLDDARAPVCLVSNEVGLGIVPGDPLSRSFRDWQGRLNQAVAAKVDTAIFMAAGLALPLKPAAPGALRGRSADGTSRGEGDGG